MYFIAGFMQSLMERGYISLWYVHRKVYGLKELVGSGMESKGVLSPMV